MSKPAVILDVFVSFELSHFLAFGIYCRRRRGRVAVWPGSMTQVIPCRDVAFVYLEGRVAARCGPTGPSLAVSRFDRICGGRGSE